MRRTDPRRPRRPAPPRPEGGTDHALCLTLSLRFDFATERASVLFLREAGGRVEQALPHALDADVTAEPVGRALLDAIADYLIETGRMPRPPDAAEPTAPDQPADG
jgi:hypothetical protein